MPIDANGKQAKATAKLGKANKIESITVTDSGLVIATHLVLGSCLMC